MDLVYRCKCSLWQGIAGNQRPIYAEEGVVGLVRYGKTLTVTTMDTLPEEDDEREDRS